MKSQRVLATGETGRTADATLLLTSLKLLHLNLEEMTKPDSKGLKQIHKGLRERIMSFGTRRITHIEK